MYFSEDSGCCESRQKPSRDLSAYVAAGKGFGTDLKQKHVVVKLEVKMDVEICDDKGR